MKDFTFKHRLLNPPPMNLSPGEYHCEFIKLETKRIGAKKSGLVETQIVLRIIKKIKE